MNPRCPKGHLVHEEHDGVSYYLLCRTCGWMGHLLPDGSLYQPPTELDPEDKSNVAGHQGPQKPNATHSGRFYRDGCQVHDHCLTCPLPDCLIGEPWKQNQMASARRREMWFHGLGKSLAEITEMDVKDLAQREGINERTVYRRLAKLRQAETAQL